MLLTICDQLVSISLLFYERLYLNTLRKIVPNFVCLIYFAAISIVATAVPLICGTLFRCMFPNVAEKVTKVLGLFCLLFCRLHL